MKFSTFLKWLEVPHEGGTLPSRWINNDIKPIEKARRTWGFWTFHNLWVTIDVNISTYLLGSSLIAIGLTWWQSIICIVIGSLLVTLFVILNSTPGSYYHLGFPVASRFSWGMYGSQFLVLNRILLSVVWYAIQAWIGGQCAYVCLQAIWPNIETRIPNHMPHSTGMTTAQFTAYIIFCALSLPLIWIRPHKLEPVLLVTVAVELVLWFTLLIWALATMGPEGFGSTITDGRTTPLDSTGWTIVYGIVSNLGTVSAGILNQSDYARFARRPRAVIQGQLVASSSYIILSGVIGILVTAATQNRYGEALWNLPDLLSRIIETGGSRSRAAAFFAGVALMVSQFGINIPGNALSGGFDLAATFPRFINIRRGAYITALSSMAVNPWYLLSTATVFLSVMSAYGIFLGPMVGTMISAYYVVHLQKINVDDLYTGTSNSIYWHTLGVDWRAPVAWICGTAPSMPGFIASVNPSTTSDTGTSDTVTVSTPWRRIYYVNFLVGFAIASTVYVLLHRVFPAQRVRAFVDTPVSRKEVIAFYRDKWDEIAMRGRGRSSSSGSESHARLAGEDGSGAGSVSDDVGGGVSVK